MRNNDLPIAEAVQSPAFDPRLAQMLLKKAVECSELVFGRSSPETCACLIELADFMERFGNFEEAQSLTERYRSILISIALDLDIS